MTAQHTQNLPLALDLANWLESVSTGLSANQAAAELRRLHAASERLAALEAALAEPEQEPDAWIDGGNEVRMYNPEGYSDWTPLYTRPATPLMGKQIDNYIRGMGIDEREDLCSFSFHAGVRWAEREHGIGVKK